MENFEDENILDLQNDLNSVLKNSNEIDEESEENYSEDTQSRYREEVLALQDISEIGADEYLIFYDYAIANIYTIMSKSIKVKKPNRATIEEMAKETISEAIKSYDIEEAIKKSSTFRTYLYWKAKAAVTKYVRELVKASKNQLNTGDEEFASALESNVIQADSEGNIDLDNDIDMPDYHRTDKRVMEQGKKIEWAMRQVRFELPRENNLILDVGIGEFFKLDGLPFSLKEWAEYTDQDVTYVRKLFKASKRLIKQKLYRKGYMDIVLDEEKTSEDLVKDTKIEEQIKVQEEDENIIESTDMETILAEAEEALSFNEDVEKIFSE